MLEVSMESPNINSGRFRSPYTLGLFQGTPHRSHKRLSGRAGFYGRCCTSGIFSTLRMVWPVDWIINLTYMSSTWSIVEAQIYGMGKSQLPVLAVNWETLVRCCGQMWAGRDCHRNTVKRITDEGWISRNIRRTTPGAKSRWDGYAHSKGEASSREWGVLWCGWKDLTTGTATLSCSRMA